MAGVSRLGWLSGTPFYPRSHFVFRHKLAVEDEPVDSYEGVLCECFFFKL